MKNNIDLIIFFFKSGEFPYSISSFHEILFTQGLGKYVRQVCFLTHGKTIHKMEEVIQLL